MSRRLDDTDLDNLEAAALGRTDVGVFAHPLDILRLVEEVRYYKKWMDLVSQVSGFDPRIEYKLDADHYVVTENTQT